MSQPFHKTPYSAEITLGFVVNLRSNKEFRMRSACLDTINLKWYLAKERTATMNVLIVEDESNLADALSHILQESKYHVDCANDGKTGLDWALTNMYDAIVLDIMLPGMDGIEVCRTLRSKGISTPVIILTARSEIRDKVAGLDAGADDYLTKPFDPEELCARLRALTRRTGEVVLDSVSYGDLELGLADLELKCADKAVRLSQREGAVMELLMRSPQNVFSKQALLTRVWGTEGETGVNNVEAYISFLRKKLAFLKSNVSIDTIRMLGYRLSCPEDCKA